MIEERFEVQRSHLKYPARWISHLAMFLAVMCVAIMVSTPQFSRIASGLCLFAIVMYVLGEYRRKMVTLAVIRDMKEANEKVDNDEA